MQVNKRQELYFATVVFILLTVHFLGNGLTYFDAAQVIRENCSGWSSCSTFEQEIIDETERKGVTQLFISLIMAGLAFFFSPQSTEEDKQKREKIRHDIKEKIAAENAEREKNRQDLKEKIAAENAEREKNRIELSEKRKDELSEKRKEIEKVLMLIVPRDILEFIIKICAIIIPIYLGLVMILGS